jgi:hypothetical protein
MATCREQGRHEVNCREAMRQDTFHIFPLVEQEVLSASVVAITTKPLSSGSAVEDRVPLLAHPSHSGGPGIG